MNMLEPGWYLDREGEPFKVWPGGGTSWYANEGDKALPLPSNPVRLFGLMGDDWDLVRQALEAAYHWSSNPDLTPDWIDHRERLHAIAGSMYYRNPR